MIKKFLVIILIASLIGAGFWVGRLSQNFQPLPSKNNPDLITDESDDQFTTKSATIQGRVENVRDDELKIVNEKGQAIALTVPVNVSIVTYNLEREASSSTDLKKLSQNDNVLVNLIYLNGQYQISSITKLPTRITDSETKASPSAILKK